MNYITRHEFNHENDFILTYLRHLKKEPPMQITDYLNLYENHNLETTIDHWIPQKKSDGTNYSQVFINKYLHNIGNLVLATRGRNSQDNNDLPEKRDKSSVLLSRQEM
jgi:hypothetical protein